MSLILALGSNIEDRFHHLARARKELARLFRQEGVSHIYESAAVDYCQQAPFLNQVIQYKKPRQRPQQVLDTILTIEHILGRVRTFDKGPRTIDIDIIFRGYTKTSSQRLQIPHPRWAQRAFVYWPLQELPMGPTLTRFFCPGKLFKKEPPPQLRYFAASYSQIPASTL